MFEHTAFRLEVGDRYDASYENESLRKFFAGEQDDLLDESRLVMLRDLTAQGRRFTRVRVVNLTRDRRSQKNYLLMTTGCSTLEPWSSCISTARTASSAASSSRIQP